MGLLPPLYVPVEEIKQLPIVHRWDDWDPYEILPEVDPVATDELRSVHNRGITAFAIGCAEWVVYRLENYSDDQVPYDYLEAYWANIMGFDQVDIPVTPNEQWQGAIRGPMAVSLMTVMNTFFMAEEGPPIAECRVAESTVLHVLSREDLFLRWRDAVVARLVTLCPRDEGDPDGPPVPREVLNPGVGLEPRDFPGLVEIFLKQIDYDSNPHLLTT